MGLKLRITPLDKPDGFVSRLIFLFLKKDCGKVIIPARVIYSRYPTIGLLVKKLYDVEKGMKLLSDGNKFLIQNRVATLNGCAFCMDISKRRVLDKKIGLAKFNDLMRYEWSLQFSDKERAIFKYAQEMTQNIEVYDDAYYAVSTHCSEKEIIEITD